MKKLFLSMAALGLLASTLPAAAAILNRDDLPPPSPTSICDAVHHLAGPAYWDFLGAHPQCRRDSSTSSIASGNYQHSNHNHPA